MLTCKRGTKGSGSESEIAWNYLQLFYPKPFTPETATNILHANAFFSHWIRKWTGSRSPKDRRWWASPDLDRDLYCPMSGMPQPRMRLPPPAGKTPTAPPP